MVTIDGSTHIEQDAMEIDDGGEQATFEWKKGNAVVEPSPIDKNNTDWVKFIPQYLQSWIQHHMIFLQKCANLRSC